MKKTIFLMLLAMPAFSADLSNVDLDYWIFLDFSILEQPHIKPAKKSEVHLIIDGQVLDMTFAEFKRRLLNQDGNSGIITQGQNGGNNLTVQKGEK